jgi:translation initiation factor 2B subunit (eIF-2B alpha/beta/delta family)
MAATGLLNIITNTLPKKINDIINKILDILFKINEGVRILNSIDFCNPLGFILTQALPPGGVLENQLNKYGLEVTKFISKINEKIDSKIDESNIKELQIDIEEIRQSLESLLPPPELTDIIPGGEGLTKTINSLNLALTFTDDIVSKTDIQNRISLLQTFKNKLAPFTSPINIANLVIRDKAEELNKQLRDFIRPERFSSDLRKIINGVKSIDKSLKQLQQTVILINNIIKILNTLIKVYKLIAKILKLSPKPTAIIPPQSGGLGVAEGTIITKADRVRQYQNDIDKISNVLKKLSNFLNVSIINQIRRIRNEILILLTGLNELYKNINACPYINDDLLKQELEQNVQSLQDSLILLDELFPTVQIENTALPKLYNGYQINIIKEEAVDEGITLLRRRVIVTNQQGIIQYEGTPTYAPNDQVLIKEGEFYIDRQGDIGTNDPDTTNISNEDITNIVKQIGVNPDDTIIGTVTPD